MNPLAILDFLKSPLFKYLMIALVVAGGLFYVYSKGEDHIQAKWDAANLKTEAEIKDLKDKADKITIKTEIQYVDRIKTIKVKGDTIIQKVPTFITVADNASYRVNVGFIRVLNAAAQNILPGDPNEIDRAPAGVDLATVGTSVAGNYTTCLIYKERALAWETWAKEQKAINP